MDVGVEEITQDFVPLGAQGAERIYGARTATDMEQNFQGRVTGEGFSGKDAAGRYGPTACCELRAADGEAKT